MVTAMAKRVVIETSLYYDENVVNYVVIHPEDSMFAHTNRIEILNEYGVFEFEVLETFFCSCLFIILDCIFFIRNKV